MSIRIATLVRSKEKTTPPGIFVHDFHVAWEISCWTCNIQPCRQWRTCLWFQQRIDSCHDDRLVVTTYNNQSPTSNACQWANHNQGWLQKKTYLKSLGQIILVAYISRSLKNLSYLSGCKPSSNDISKYIINYYWFTGFIQYSPIYIHQNYISTDHMWLLDWWIRGCDISHRASWAGATWLSRWMGCGVFRKSTPQFFSWPPSWLTMANSSWKFMADRG